VDGLRIGEPPTNFTRLGGLTNADRMFVAENVGRGVAPLEIWRARFRDRGMNFCFFFKVAERLRDITMENGAVRTCARVDSIYRRLANGVRSCRSGY